MKIYFSPSRIAFARTEVLPFTSILNAPVGSVNFTQANPSKSQTKPKRHKFPGKNQTLTETFLFHFFQNRMTWEQVAPVSFQLFINDNFNQDKTMFSCALSHSPWLHGIMTKEDLDRNDFSSCHNSNFIIVLNNRMIFPHASKIAVCTLTLEAPIAPIGAQQHL